MGTRDAWIGWLAYRGCNKRLARCDRCIGGLACTSLVRRVVEDMSEEGIPDGRHGGALVDAGAGDCSEAMEGPRCGPRCHKLRRKCEGGQGNGASTEKRTGDL